MATARGHRILFGLARESADYGIPGTDGLSWFHPTLPISADLVSQEEELGAAHPLGYRQAGVPGQRTGAIEFTDRFTPERILPFVEHLLGGLTKSNPATGVYRYVAEPNPDGVSTSFWGMFNKPSVERRLQYGIKFGSLVLPLELNQPINATLAGVIQHGTKVGIAVPDGGNSGTYARGPWLRGPVLDQAAGTIYVKVTQITPTLQFKVEQTSGTPTYGGSAQTQYIDPNTNRAAWMSLLDDAGLDLGLVTLAGNRDPLEIVFPGTAAQHAAELAVDDVFAFPLTWSDPSTTVLAGQHLTTAHLRAYWRAIGAGTWIPITLFSGELSIENELTPEFGTGSRYLAEVDQTFNVAATLTTTRRFRDLTFVDAHDRHERVEFLLRWEGEQLDATYRRAVEIEFPSLYVGASDRTPSEAAPINEEIELMAETNSADDPPFTVTITTDRNYTVAT